MVYVLLSALHIIAAGVHGIELDCAKRMLTIIIKSAVKSKLICFGGERAGPVDKQMKMMVAGIKCPLSNFTAISEQTHFVTFAKTYNLWGQE